MNLTFKGISNISRKHNGNTELSSCYRLKRIHFCICHSDSGKLCWQFKKKKKNSIISARKKKKHLRFVSFCFTIRIITTQSSNLLLLLGLVCYWIMTEAVCEEERVKGEKWGHQALVIWYRGFTAAGLHWCESFSLLHQNQPLIILHKAVWHAVVHHPYNLLHVI